MVLVPAYYLLKKEQLQLAQASFRDLRSRKRHNNHRSALFILTMEATFFSQNEMAALAFCLAWTNREGAQSFHAALPTLGPWQATK